MNIDTKKMLNY